MKKLLIALFFAATFSKAHAAETDIKINGSYIKSDVAPVIQNDTVLMPIRAAANALGCENVEWNSSQKTVTLDGGKTVLTIWKNYAYANGKKVSLSSPAIIKNDRTMVPLRFIAESFGATVEWNAKTHTVEITLDGHTVAGEYIDSSYTSSDLEWLAKIVCAEAEGEPDDGKIAVANVVLNRVADKAFPNSVYDVIFDSKYGVQFTPTADGRIYNDADVDSYIAAKKALKGENIVGKCLYFCNIETSTNFWIVNNRTHYATIGNHDFYL